VRKQLFPPERFAAARKVVIMNRTNPPDAILCEVDEPTGISQEDLAAISERYKAAAGPEVNALNARPSFL
jgi:hypothetical protein